MLEIKKPQDYSLKNMRKSLKEKGQFYTSEELAQTLKSYLPDDGSPVLDPTCGHGALLTTFSEEVEKVGCDIEADAIQWASENLKNFKSYYGNFLEISTPKFKRIIANPPFSVEWKHEESALAPAMRAQTGKIALRKRADWAFLFKIAQSLEEDGTAVVLNFPGILYRQNEAVFREDFIARNLIDRIVFVEGGHFEDTKVATVILVLKKNRKSETVIFEELETGRNKAVDIYEIADNDYDLSFNRWLPPESEPVEEFDPVYLEKLARVQMWQRLKKDLSQSKLICELEGWDFEKYRQFLLNMIENFDK